MPRIIPIRDLKNTSAISQMCSESNEPVYITKNGYGDMVVMSMKAYEEKLFMEAESDIQEGKVSDAREGLRTLRDKYGL